MSALRPLLLLPLLSACAPAIPQVDPATGADGTEPAMEFAIRSSCLDDECTSIALTAIAAHSGTIYWSFVGERAVREGRMQELTLPPGQSSWEVVVWNADTMTGVQVAGQVVRPEATSPTDPGSGGDTGDTGASTGDTGWDTEPVPTSQNLVGGAASSYVPPTRTPPSLNPIVTRPYILATHLRIDKIIVNVNRDSGTLTGVIYNSCKYLISLGGSTPGVGGCVADQAAVAVSCDITRKGTTMTLPDFYLNIKSLTSTGTVATAPNVKSMGFASGAKWNVAGIASQVGNWSQPWLGAELDAPLSTNSILLVYDASLFGDAASAPTYGSISVSHLNRPMPFGTWSSAMPEPATYDCNHPVLLNINGM